MKVMYNNELYVQMEDTIVLTEVAGLYDEVGVDNTSSPFKTTTLEDGIEAIIDTSGEVVGYIGLDSSLLTPAHSCCGCGGCK